MLAPIAAQRLNRHSAEETRRAEPRDWQAAGFPIAPRLLESDADLMISRPIILVLTVFSLTACSVEVPPADERKPDPSMESPRIKDRVLDILCDDEARNVPQELVLVVNDARERDGQSDRVWEVADNADCRELGRDSKKMD